MKIKKYFQSNKQELLNIALIAGAVLIVAAIGTEALAQGDTSGGGRFSAACSWIVGLMRGPFGAMIAAAAGIGAIIASAVGGFKMAWTLVVVSVGAFILEGFLTLFFAGGCG